MMAVVNLHAYMTSIDTAQIQTTGIGLLKQGNYTEALTCLRGIPSPNSSLAAAIIQLAQAHEQEGQLDKALYLREIAIEWDPSSHENLFYLIALAAALADDWRVAIHTQSLSEVWESQLDPQIPSLRKVLSMGIPHLLEKHYADSFFEILGVYCRHYLTDADQRAILGLLYVLSTAYFPEASSDYEQGWDPMDLTQPIIRDTMNFFKKSPLRGASLLASYLEISANKLDVSLSQSREKQFYLLAETIEYYLNSSQHHKAKQIITSILQQWSLELLDQLQPLPGQNKGSYRFFFDFTFKICFHLPYLTDNRSLIRSYQRIAEKHLSRFTPLSHPHLTHLFSNRDPLSLTRPIKVGYVGLGFNQHPVGFLSYQTLLHHDPKAFQIYCYDISPELFDEDDLIRPQLRAGIHAFHDLRAKPWQDILTQLAADAIDILIYMDASTNLLGFQLLSFHPAPIQMSWLGGDSPAIPELDYFLVDPHILPEEAQTDYDEILLRLPTFAAVDSFKVGDLDLITARQNLDLPENIILFWTAANAAKRSPENIEAQLEILKNVPNGILAIKGLGDAASVASIYREKAREKSVEDRLRFIKTNRYQEDHRAQLSIADLVLDTFPYTGATHTFEALYVGTPVLTLVGRHYYGRMSYSLLKNCQLDDCITHSIDEYIQRGIQLGRDPARLAQVKAQVKGSRSSSVIWDAKGFARSLEAVYRQVIEERIQS